MKKVKLLLLIPLCVFLSGCTIEYHLNIDDASYIEKVDITPSNDQEDQEYAKTLRNWNMPAFYQDFTVNSDTPEKKEGIPYYTKKNHESDLGATLTYKFKEKNFENSSMAHFCYNYFLAYQNEESKTISYTASMDFNCFTTYETLEKVVVKLSTKRKMENHNADRQEGNTYIWELTKENAKGKYIFFELRQRKGLTLALFLKYLTVFLIALAIFSSFVIIYIRFRWKRANRI